MKEKIDLEYIRLQKEIWETNIETLNNKKLQDYYNKCNRLFEITQQYPYILDYITNLEWHV